MSSVNTTIKDSQVELYKIDGVTLSVLSKYEVESMGHVHVDNLLFDPEIKNGINDDRMGTMERDRLCKTCKGTQVDCPGHFGYIKLEKPVYHGNLLDYIRKVLKAVCFNCSNLLADTDDKSEESKTQLLAQYQKISNPKSRFNKVYELSSSFTRCKCGMKNRLYKKGPLKIFYEIVDDRDVVNQDRKQILWPEEAKAILSKISPKHLEFLGLSKEQSDPANMIIESLTVVPPPVRPSVQVTGSSSMGSNKRSQDDLSVAYQQIIKQNKEIERSYKSGANESVKYELREVLQFYVATLMDNKISGVGTHKHKRSGIPLKGIRERLKGKEGRLRGNLMGKRCDFTARSVITCDPNLQLDQLGVPREIALNMTIPEVVTDQNIDYLRQLVEKGANNWPGAKFIKRLDGRFIDLSEVTHRSDLHLEKGYTVERHLQDNDYVIFNRQPSLHKMSMMGHRIKVLEYQTFRLNLSVTTPYNADFDGDEMNMHVPQSLETKAEIKEIMSVPRQIVAPQKNAPCMGVVQDALLGINRLTNRDIFVEKHVLMNILMFVKGYDLSKGLPQPAIIKPKPLWTGKQVISLVIPEIVNLERDMDQFIEVEKKKVNEKMVPTGKEFYNLRDEAVIIQSGQLLQGILNKSTVGSSPGGVIHIVWKDLSPQACSDILSNIQLVVNNWLVNTGFTVGVQDIIPKPEIINQVKERLQKSNHAVRKIIRKAQKGTGSLKLQPGKSMLESFEAYVNQKLNEARIQAGKLALNALESDNRLKNMVKAGSKGSDMNISQIMACVGQQNVEGQRIKFGFNRRTLPHFAKDDYGPESKGFVENSYLTGLTPSEFYFHAMGGREGLIDTAVKTADTGYISRRLIKGLEDVMVKYDGTVRTSRELIIQFLYGEDGMAGEHFESIPLTLAKDDNKKLQNQCDFLYQIDTEAGQKKLASVVGKHRAQQILNDRELRNSLKQEFEQIVADREMLRTEIMINNVDDRVIMPVNIPRLITNAKAINRVKPNIETDLEPKYFLKEVNKLIDEIVVLPEARYAFNIARSKIIAEAHYNSAILFKICLRYYLCAKKILYVHRLDRQTFDNLITNIRETYKSAIAHPGEMAGSIAANSIGEPATQMTLNTFHNAGISSKNVTLGVPRLKEVINVAKQLKTPYMKILLDPKISKDEIQANRIGMMIQHQNLSHIVSDWGIYFDPDPKSTIIEADKELIDLYNLTETDDQVNTQENNICKWVLRFSISSDPFKVKFDDHFQFRRDVGAKIQAEINNEEKEKLAQVIYSDDFMEQKVIRIRPYLPHGELDVSIIQILREVADRLLNSFTLRGFEEISKFSITRDHTVKETKRDFFDQETGEHKVDSQNFIIETDGIALQKVMSVAGVDHTRTISNSVTEILQVLGIEATRLALISELRLILGTYDIYVNYRHITTLVDMMTLRGIITSITRHGINRVDVGPMRKCTFEETTEILLEAAFFGEYDPLTGISENILFGQMAPYGTGAFELDIDRRALMDCIEGLGEGMGLPQQTDEYTPIHVEDYGLTPIPIGTPNIYIGSMGGATSIYTPNPEGAFTPEIYPSMRTPGASPYPISTSPGGYGYGNAGLSGKYGSQTPQMPIYAATPRYDGYADQVAAAYSPSGGAIMMGGASHHSISYSPTQMNHHQTPSYSPTTPNYQGGMMTPAQHSTPTYNYGAPVGVTSNPSYGKAGVSSPSMNPNITSPYISMGSGSANMGHIPGSYSQSQALGAYGGSSTNSYLLQTPAYQNMLAPIVQRLNHTITAPAAYNPEAAENSDDQN